MASVKHKIYITGQRDGKLVLICTCGEWESRAKDPTLDAANAEAKKHLDTT